jgi:CheY-like chemotaxis protein
VVEASDGSSTAMNLIRANTERFDVFLLDVTLPGLSNREVLEESRGIRPDLTVALTGAYSKKTVNSTSPDRESGTSSGNRFNLKTWSRSCRERWHPEKYKEQVLCWPLLCRFPYL